MLAFAIFAVVFVAALLLAVIYLYPGSTKPTTIPGCDPTSKEDGNLGDIRQAGSVHEFLIDLHGQFGAIAGFWWGTTYVVSIASAKLFKEHQNIFDRPPELFQLFMPLNGPKCLQFANGTEGRGRRGHYDKCLTHDAIKQYFTPLQEVGDKLAAKWSTLLNEEHVPLCEFMFMYACKSVLVALFGEMMKNDQEVLEFEKVYNLIWHEMEVRQTEKVTETREKAFQKGKEYLHKIVNRVIENRKTNPPQHGEELMVDLIIEYTDDGEMQLADTLLYVIGGFHTTGNALSWGFYFLATHPDVQEKVHNEIKSVLGDEDVDHSNMGELVYLRQVIDETLRCAVVAPYAARFQTFDTQLALSWGFYFLATHPDVQEKVHNEIKSVLGDEDVDHSNMGELVYLRQVIDETLRCAVVAPYAARFQTFDTQLGGHKIPKNTPVIHALGVASYDETVWPLPNKFDPDRFSEENKKDRSNLSFSPFGFSGKRVCPGQRFAYAEATVCFVTLLRKFKVHMVEGQVVTPVHGLVTHPSEEIWVTLSKR